jgi:hypothetical protein
VTTSENEPHLGGEGVAHQYRYDEYYPGDLVGMQASEILGEYTELFLAATREEDYTPDATFHYHGLLEKIDYLAFVDLDQAQGLLKTAAQSNGIHHQNLAAGSLAYNVLSAATLVPDNTERERSIQDITDVWARLARKPELYVSCYDSFYRQLLYGGPEDQTLSENILLSNVRDIMLALQARWLVGEARTERPPTTDPDMARIMLIAATRSKDSEHQALAVSQLASRLLQADARIEDPVVRQASIEETIELWGRPAYYNDPALRKLAHASFYLDFLFDDIACSRITLADIRRFVPSLEPEDAGR